MIESSMHKGHSTFYIVLLAYIASAWPFGLYGNSSGYVSTISYTQQQNASNQVDEPASIVLVIDMSSSAFNKKEDERQAFSDSLLHFVQHANQQNEYYLIAVRTRPYLLLERVTDTKIVINRIKKLFSEGQKGATALYDACYVGVSKLMQSKYGRRLAIIVSDGIDTSSSKSFKDLQKLAVKIQVRLYTVSISSIEKDLVTSMQGKIVLGALAEASGGKSFHLRNIEEIRSAFETISTELKH
jgi:VWFA-related protein